jgi:hypothetical protein
VLTIINCEGVFDFDHAYSEIEWVRMIDCRGDVRLDGLRKCTRLEYLMVRNCPGLVDLSPLESCPLLDTLDVNGCPRVRTLPNICKQMGILRIDFTSITDISILDGNAELFSLSAEGCRISDVKSLSRCHELQILRVGSLGGKRIDLGPLAGLQRLGFLTAFNVSGTDALTCCRALQKVWLYCADLHIERFSRSTNPNLSVIQVGDRTVSDSFAKADSAPAGAESKSRGVGWSSWLWSTWRRSVDL